MAYRNKTYVCFDGDNDMNYYNLMKAWKQNDNTNFNFYDAHDLNNALDSSNEETIKRKLRERLNNTKIFVVLLGEHTKNLTKFVRWEMEQAIKMNLPIIVVNINKKRKVDDELFPPILDNYLTVSISYEQKIMQYALENWEEEFFSLQKDGVTGARSYPDSIYNSLN